MMRLLLGLCLVGAMCGAALADTTILNETFDGYADTGAMQAQWVSTDPNPSRIADMSINPDAFPLGGQGVEHLGGAVNIWSGLNAGNALIPSASQSVRVEVDVYNDAVSANKRVSLGLRGSGNNLIELGAWNADTCDPTVSGCVPGTTLVGGPGFIPSDLRGLAHRLQLFAGIADPLTVQPNWQFFELPLELDTSLNGVVSLSEVGAGWSHYTATITPDSVTISIDLYRDGVRNVSSTPGDGTVGVDATVTWPVVSFETGYSDLRFGGPSGVASGGGSLIFDNIKLSLVDVVVGGSPDFNSSGTVDAADYTVWRDHLGLTGTGTQATGDANGDTNVDATDYDLWKAAFGTMPGSGAGLGGAAVPEPASLILALAAALAITCVDRRRSLHER